MNILPVNSNINSNNTSFGAVRVVGSFSSKVEELVRKSMLGKVEQDYFVLSKSCKVSKYDYNHPPDTKLFWLQLVKPPKNYWEKLRLKLGFPRGEDITNGYRSIDRGIPDSLTDRHIAAVMKRLG